MRIIDKIEEKLEQYKQHFDSIEEHFNRENEQFKVLMQTNHNVIGHILKCHLILENYITNYLAFKFNGIDLDSARLTFVQKINLLPDNDLRVAFLKKGIAELNIVRNKYSHNLKANVPIGNYNGMLEVLNVARKDTVYENPINIIEDFTTVACTFLIVNPPEIHLLFEEVFKSFTQ